MMTIEYKGQFYKCEITHKDNNATRVRVYDDKNVGNLYIWTTGYDMPRPYKYNTSKRIVKNVVLKAFEELTKEVIIEQVVEEAAMTVLPEETPVVRTRQRTPRKDRFND